MMINKLRRIIRSNIKLVHYRIREKPAVKIRGYDKAAKVIEQYIINAIPEKIQHPTKLYTDLIWKYDAATAFVIGFNACRDENLLEVKNGHE